MQFPIQIVFKILALAPQMYVNDGAGKHLGYVKQRLLAFKEKVTVYTDDTQQTPIYSIAADRVIDFNAEYHFSNAQGVVLGSVKRSGMRSFWRAHYVINLGGVPTFEFHEESGWVHLIDGVLGEIPLVGFLTGYFLNPKYNITRTQGAAALRMLKQRSLFESTFTIEQQGELSAPEQEAAMLGLMMIVLLERSRG